MRRPRSKNIFLFFSYAYYETKKDHFPLTLSYDAGSLNISILRANF